MSDLTLLHELPELLRVDFCAFVVRCFATLDSKQLEMGDYIEVIASRLADVQNGEIRRLIINVPPRHLKSLIASIGFPAWSLGQNPSTKIMCVSYGETLTS